AVAQEAEHDACVRLCDPRVRGHPVRHATATPRGRALTLVEGAAELPEDRRGQAHLALQLDARRFALDGGTHPRPRVLRTRRAQRQREGYLALPDRAEPGPGRGRRREEAEGIENADHRDTRREPPRCSSRPSLWW